MSVLICEHGTDITLCKECSGLPTEFYETFQRGDFPHQKNVYHVSALSSCLTLHYHLIRGEVPTTPFGLVFSALHGQAMHRNLEWRFRGAWHELPVYQRIKLGKDSITITGRVDLYMPTSRTILDLKTVTVIAKNHEARPWQINQIQIYKHLLERYLKRKVKHLVIVYIGHNSVRPVEVPLEDKWPWCVERARILHDALRREREPSVDYCEYKPIQKGHHDFCTHGK